MMLIRFKSLDIKFFQITVKRFRDTDQARGLQSHLNFKVDLNLRFSLKIDKSVLQSFS